ncbi:MAG: bifunctional DNA primase/polymerase [Emcibacter sp.]|nr:bifunctional DNA primase/polymerase [Emcibacter sp.]
MAIHLKNGGGFGSRLFSSHAPDYAEYGLTVFPVGGENGKIPQVKNWRKFGPRTWEKLSSKYDNDNIGIVNKTLTIVDIDDPKLFHKCLNRFGDTPIKIQTPGGGFHLWYQSNGEARRIGINGQAVDLLGKGGFAVAPPSIKPAGGCYSFIEGDVTDIPNLPTIKANALPDPINNTATKQGKSGTRNNNLFNFCLKAARGVKSENELAEIALTESAKFNQPLDVEEVHKIVQSAWNYEISGKNLTGRNAILIETEIFEKLVGHPEAFYLMTFLTKKHARLRDIFFIDQEKVCPLIGIKDPKTIRKAIQNLIDKRLLQYVGKGGISGKSKQYRMMTL